MGKEFEFKIIEPNIELFKQLLKKNNGVMVHPKHKMYRHVFDHPDPSVDGFIRLRKEGDNKVTLTCKIFNKSKYPLEYELSLNESYEKGLEFLQKSGLNLKSYQETAREKWKHPLAKEIVFDDWPGIPEFIEVDCESEDNLKEMKKILDVNNRNIMYDGVDTLYNELYNIPKKKFNRVPSLTFKNFKSELMRGGGKRTRKRNNSKKNSNKNKKCKKTRKNK